MNKSNNQVPRLAKKVLRSFLREDLREEVEGDLEEKFYYTASKKSLVRARINYWYQTLNYIRPFALRRARATNPPVIMIRHNMVIAYRNFRKYKTSFLINIIGLSAGLASVLMIYLWVNDEISIDKFHEKDSRLFQVMSKGSFGGDEIHTSTNNSDLLVPALVEELSDVEYAVPVAGPFNHGVLTAGEKSIKSQDRFAGKDFFNVFSYKLILGDRDHILIDKYSIVISDDLAVRLFGTLDNVIGKSITWDGHMYAGTYVVTGVFESPKRSSQSFDFLLTITQFLANRPADYINWGSNSSSAYITVKEGVNVDSFNDKINRFYFSKINPLFGKEYPEWTYSMFVVPFSDQYLHGRYVNGEASGGRIEYVILFSTIALFILVIACINFMNLATARASRRLKEIGIKKAIGAVRRTLILQHLSESMIMVALSLAIALLLVYFLLPEFNLVTGKNLSFQFSPRMVLSTLGIALTTGLLSGSYPALYLSSFRPAQILKGKLDSSMAELWARRGLVVFQFSISILLIMSVVIVYNQIQYVQKKNLGYDKDHIIIVNKEGKLEGNSSSIETLLTQVKTIPGVVNASTLGYEIGRPSTMTGGVFWEGKADDDRTESGIMDVDYDLIETMGFHLQEGRTFSRQFSTDNTALVCNTTAVKIMRLKDPIGKKVKLWGNDFTIIGVVDDFFFESLYSSVKPSFFRLSSDNPKIAIRLQPGSETEALPKVAKAFNGFNPNITFDYDFMDSQYKALYVSEQRVADLSGYFALIAILISCLGLFGLASFTAERRAKEIGIRKIMGSSEWGIIYMLSFEFTKMVIIAIFITLPVSYFLANEWLGTFAYRIALNGWYFGGAGFAAMLIAWLTVSFQVIKAARLNPVETLRSE